jgi:oligoendopeptidase F
MQESSGKKKSGAEQVEWDLSDLYDSTSDPRLDEDRQKALGLSEVFNNSYRGKVDQIGPETFAVALREYEEIIQLIRKIGSYAQLIWSTNTEDPELGKLLQQSRELGSEISQKLVFFDVEWLKLSDEKAGESWTRTNCRSTGTI